MPESVVERALSSAEDGKTDGCLELTSAGIGLAQAGVRGGPATSDWAIEVFETARVGDPNAEALINRAAGYLALAAVAISNIIAPF